MKVVRNSDTYNGRRGKCINAAKLVIETELCTSYGNANQVQHLTQPSEPDCPKPVASLATRVM